MLKLYNKARKAAYQASENRLVVPVVGIRSLNPLIFYFFENIPAARTIDWS